MGTSANASYRYTYRHKVERRKLKTIVDAGHAYCCEIVCLESTRQIQAGAPWDLAHDRAATIRAGHDVYLGPAHRRCNRAEALRWRHTVAPVPTVTSSNRDVILVCGPPGAGKTTYARPLGLDLYDRDDVRWRNDEARFTAVTSRLAADPNAKAVVIRAGATQSARDAAAQRVGATRTVLLVPPDPTTCIRRVRMRDRPYPSMGRQIAAVREWYRKYEPSETDTVLTTQRAAEDASRWVL